MLNLRSMLEHKTAGFGVQFLIGEGFLLGFNPILCSCINHLLLLEARKEAKRGGNCWLFREKIQTSILVYM